MPHLHPIIQEISPCQTPLFVDVEYDKNVIKQYEGFLHRHKNGEESTTIIWMLRSMTAFLGHQTSS